MRSNAVGFASLVLVALVVTALAGCSGKGGNPPDAGQGAGLDPAVLTQMELPAPSTLKLAQGVVSDVYHTGSDYVTGWPCQHVFWLDEGAAEYGPLSFFDPVGTEEVHEPAYAIYYFDTTGFCHGSTITTDWATTGGDGDAWIGMADFTADAWRWHRIGPEGIAHFDAEACLDDGVTYALVVLTGTTRWRLESIHLGFELPPLISSVRPLSGEEGAEITLRALLNIPAEQVTTWYWDLGGAGSIGTSGDAAPTLTLGSPGFYECSVRASNAWGETEYPFVLTVDEAGADWRHAVVGTLDELHSLEFPTSLALGFDSPKNPHIAYSFAIHIAHAYLDDSFWRTDTAYTFVREMTNTSLATDSAGVVHLVCSGAMLGYNYDHYYVIHAQAPGGVWQHEIVAEYMLFPDNLIEMRDFREPSMALDDDRLGVCFETRHYSEYEEGGWPCEAVSLDYWAPPAQTVGTFERYRLRGYAVDLNAAGDPRIAFTTYDYTETGKLFYAELTGSGVWETEFVHSASSSGDADVILEFAETDNQPRICFVYKDPEGDRHICYARFDGSDWHFVMMDPVSSVRDHLSMALDSVGRPRICYRGEGLRYVSPDDLSWDDVSVDDAGKFCDIAVDEYDRAHISYYDDANRYIKYAWEAFSK